MADPIDPYEPTADEQKFNDYFDEGLAQGMTDDEAYDFAVASMDPGDFSHAGDDDE